VLHLARRVAFGVDVGDLLQLEGALESDGVVDAAAQVQEVGLPEVGRRQALVLAGPCQ